MINIPLQTQIVYGPVNSRRLGKSLGLNILPSSYKLCTYDCVYCQYGWTSAHAPDADGKESDLPSLADIDAALSKALEDAVRTKNSVDYITFSGNGEPTLYPKFPQAVEVVLHLRDRHIPEAKVAILSNSSTVGDEKIRIALGRLDLRIMKFDAATDDVFRKINRPVQGLRFDDILGGLKKLDSLVIQSLFVEGQFSNCGVREVEKWISALEEIRPVEVQIYTLDRPPASEKALTVERKKLEAIAKKASERGLKVVPFWRE